MAAIESTLYGRSKKNPLTKPEVAKLKTDHEALAIKVRQLEDELVPPAMLTEDATQEMLAVLMQHNREQLLSFSPDASRAIQILEGLYNRLSASDDNFFVRAYSGDPFSVHRISRPAINLEHPCLTLFWLLQPYLFEKMLANQTLREGGFLVRLLVCDTRLEPQEKTDAIRPIPLKTLQEYDELLRALVVAYWDNPNPSEIELPKEGEALFRDYHNELVPLRKGQHKDITSFIARWPEQARRIAIGLHAAIHSDQCHQHQLSPDTIAKAIGIIRWFSTEQLRMLAAGRQDLLFTQMQALRDLILIRYPIGVSLRALLKNHAKTEDEVMRLVKKFPAVFEFKDYQPRGGGRPTQHITVRKAHL